MEIKPLNGMKIAILVTDGFEQVEMLQNQRGSPGKSRRKYNDSIPQTLNKVQGFNHVDKADSFA